MHYPLDLSTLNQFMLTSERMNHYLSYSINNNINKLETDVINKNKKYNNNEKIENQEKIKKPFFIPKQKDNLFWCFYIIVNGIDKYQSLDFINIVVEKTMKIEYVEHFRKKKELLKINKCAPLLHIENMLVNEYKIDIKTFIALCVLENKNILYINNKCYYELKMNSSSEINIIHFFSDKFKYGFEVENLKAEEYKKSLYKMTNLDKPIKAMSSYNIDELQEIATKLGLETKKEDGKNILKKDIYEKIIISLKI